MVHDLFLERSVILNKLENDRSSKTFESSSLSTFVIEQSINALESLSYFSRIIFVLYSHRLGHIQVQITRITILL